MFLFDIKYVGLTSLHFYFALIVSRALTEKLASHTKMLIYRKISSLFKTKLVLTPTIEDGQILQDDTFPLGVWI